LKKILSALILGFTLSLSAPTAVFANQALEQMKVLECQNKARFVYQISQLRDQGASKEDVILLIPDYNEYKGEIDAILEVIFDKASGTTPENLAQSFFEYCVQEPIKQSM
jgi:pilus assembly protein TadC